MLINHERRLITFSIAYHGAGLCGQTSNIKHMYRGTRPEARRACVYIKALPEYIRLVSIIINIPRIQDFRVRLHLTACSTNLWFSRARYRLLGECDGVILVADSQQLREPANTYALHGLEASLISHGRDLERMPMVIQYNKRDLSEISTVDAMRARLNSRYPDVPDFEAVAPLGHGVFPSLKAVVKKILVGLKKNQIELKTQAPEIRELFKGRPTHQRPVPPPNIEALPGLIHTSTTTTTSLIERCTAIRKIAATVVPTATSALLSLLHDPDIRVSTSAARALRSHFSARTIQETLLQASLTLIQALNAPEFRSGEFAFEYTVLATLNILLPYLDETRPATLSTLQETVVDALNSTHRPYEWIAAELIAQHPWIAPSNPDPIISLLFHKSLHNSYILSSVYNDAVIRALAKIPHPRATAALLSAARNAPPLHHIQALTSAIARHSPPLATRVLLPLALAWPHRVHNSKLRAIAAVEIDRLRRHIDHNETITRLQRDVVRSDSHALSALWHEASRRHQRPLMLALALALLDGHSALHAALDTTVPWRTIDPKKKTPDLFSAPISTPRALMIGPRRVPLPWSTPLIIQWLHDELLLLTKRNEDAHPLTKLTANTILQHGLDPDKHRPCLQAIEEDNTLEEATRAALLTLLDLRPSLPLRAAADALAYARSRARYCLADGCRQEQSHRLALRLLDAL